MNRHRKLMTWTVISLVIVWLAAWGGYQLTQRMRITGEKVQAYLRSVDLRKLRNAARQDALRKLASQLNALSPEDRRKARLDQEWNVWFQEMTEDEKAEFLDATVPKGFQQILEAFEQLPEDKRKRAVETALRRLRETQDQMAAMGDNRPSPSSGARAPVYLSEDLRQRVIKLGLKTYYSESSAQTKAELAPLLEEIQSVMERNPGYIMGHRQ